MSIYQGMYNIGNTIILIFLAGWTPYGDSSHLWCDLGLGQWHGHGSACLPL